MADLIPPRLLLRLFQLHHLRDYSALEPILREVYGAQALPLLLALAQLWPRPDPPPSRQFWQNTASLLQGLELGWNLREEPLKIQPGYIQDKTQLSQAQPNFTSAVNRSLNKIETTTRPEYNLKSATSINRLPPSKLPATIQKPPTAKPGGLKPGLSFSFSQSKLNLPPLQQVDQILKQRVDLEKTRLQLKLAREEGEPLSPICEVRRVQIDSKSTLAEVGLLRAKTKCQEVQIAVLRSRVSAMQQSLGRSLG